MVAWLAAATSYSTSAYAMVPFYIFYSMFGFQRIGDSAWQAADMRARGFLLGATAGRTTFFKYDVYSAFSAALVALFLRSSVIVWSGMLNLVCIDLT